VVTAETEAPQGPAVLVKPGFLSALQGRLALPVGSAGWVDPVAEEVVAAVEEVDRRSPSSKGQVAAMLR
jgi:hypothetical protein